MSKYPRIALANALVSTEPEHYEELRKLGVKDLIVCLSASHIDHYKAGEYHTMLGRNQGFRIHAYLQTDLSKPFHDARRFFTAYQKLAFTFGTKVMIMCCPGKYVKHPGKQLNELLGYLSYFLSKEDLDVAVYKKDVDAGRLSLKDIPDYFNLTVINPNRVNSGVDKSGTWIYSDSVGEEDQYIGYDFYGFYTKQGYQLTLDTEYIAQEGDTWVTIASRHGIWLPKLLTLNKAKYEDLVVPGQRIKLY